MFKFRVVSCYKITVGSLIKDNYLDSDKNSGEYINPVDNSDMKNCKIFIYIENNRVYAELDNSVENCS